MKGLERLMGKSGQGALVGGFAVRGRFALVAWAAIRLDFRLGSRTLSADRDFRTGLQLVDAVDHDRVAGGEAAGDHHLVSLGRTDRHLPQGYGRVRIRAPIDDVDERRLGTVLDGRGRHDHHVALVADQQPSVDELVGKQQVVFILKHRLQANGSRRRIDLVVQGHQLAGGQIES